MKRLIFLQKTAVSAALALSAIGTVTAATSVGPRQSNLIAITDDDSRLVNVNQASNSVTIFDVVGNQLNLHGAIATGKEPRSVAIHPNKKTAYVANAASDSVAVINISASSLVRKVKVGVEPHALAVSPNGTRLYVACSASNTLQVFDLAIPDNPAVLATVDLSAFGTAPRAIAVTNDDDADDTDETVFVALFYAQLAAGKSFLQEGQDDQREGRLVALSAATNTALGAPNPIRLAPQANTGFNSNGQLAPALSGGPFPVPFVPSTNPQTFTTQTGAYPNQLASIAIQQGQGRAFVVSTAASPNGPLRFNQMAQGLVSVFNTVTRLEVTSGQVPTGFRQTAPLNLNQGINFDTVNLPRLFMTNPVAMAWRPNSSDAWVAVQNSNLIVRLTTNGVGIPTIGAPLASGSASAIVRVDLEDVAAGQIAGKAPRGIVINNAGTLAFVSNFISRSVTAINIQNATSPTIAATAKSASVPTHGIKGIQQLGAELFYTGRGPDERMSSESWGGCIVCHPNGRSDGVTWLFDTGPRQTINLDGSFKKGGRHDWRILNWSAVRDENQDFELNTRNVFGGRGLIDDDRLFLAIGGASGATPTDTNLIEQFNQALNTGAVGTNNDLTGNPLPALLGQRRDFGVASLDDGRVLIVGGRAGAGQGSLITGANAVLEFDPLTNAITKRSHTGFTPRHSLGAAAVRTSKGLRVYAIGGYASTTATDLPVLTVEEYNPTKNKWRTVQSLPVAVAQFGITVAGGINTAEPLQLIHVVSGNTGSENVPSVVNASPVQRFQPDPIGPGVFTSFTPGFTLRRNLGAATALRGAQSRVFVIGGQTGVGVVLDTVEEYQAQAGTPVNTLHTDLNITGTSAPRARFGCASSLTTNQIYVVGGVNGGGVDQTSVLEYTINANPAGGPNGPAGTPSGDWKLRGDLSVARRGLGLFGPPGVTNFLTVANTGRDPRQDAIEIFLSRGLRSHHAPVADNDPDALQGRQLFGQVGLVVPDFSCATCHGGKKWTRSKVDYIQPPSPDVGLGLGDEKVIGAELRQTLTQPNLGVLTDVGTFALAGRQNEIRFNGADISQAINPLGVAGFNIPSLLSVAETAPYYYNGLAQTLEEVLDGSKDANNPGPAKRVHFVNNPANRADLIKFLLSIDEKSPIFP